MGKLMCESEALALDIDPARNDDGLGNGLTVTQGAACETVYALREVVFDYF